MSSVIKGIVDEGEEVAVIYIDGKPSAKYAKKHEAERDAEFMRKRHPNKKIEIKHEVRETEAKKGADGKRCWKGKRYAGTENGKDKCIPVKNEAANPAQQAAIAINMKKKGKKPKVNESILTEGKVLLEGRVVRKLWESAGQKIVEAQLTPQQIQQIFQAAEQGVTAGGANRTVLGKGKDAASAVNRAWEDLKTKIQNTGPIQNMDAMYDKAAEALKNATGGDQGAMSYVQKYRDFAKKHPVAQSFLYAALIAAAGLSGAGAGGAAALGLLKMTDKLLQGQKFSSAAYAGAKTGGLAYAAGQLGQKLKGTDAQPSAAPKPGADQLDAQGYPKNVGDMDPATAADHAQYATPKPGVDAQGYPTNVGDIDPATAAEHDAWYGQGGKGMPGAVTDAPAGAAKQVAKSALEKVAGEVVNPDQPLSPVQMATVDMGKQMGKQYSQDVLNAYDLAVEKGVKPFVGSMVKHADGSVTPSSGKNPFNFESRQLSKYEVFNIMEAAVLCQNVLNEGLMDTIKGAAGKAAQWAQTKGHNITTKITADKLMQAWKKAGSPTDSEQVKAVLKSAGVADNVINTVMPVQASIAGVQPKATTGTVQSTVKATTQPTVAAKPQAPAAQPASAIGQGVAKAPNANVNPELQKRLAARKAGKPVYAGGLEEGVIVGHDKDDPEVAILGGAGTMSLSRLKKKAQGEAEQLANDLARGRFKAAAYNIKQLENTLKTIVAAEDEMSKKYFGENAWNQLGQRKPNTNLPAPERGSRVNHGKRFEEGDIVLPLSGPLKGQPHKVIHSQRTSIRIVPLGRDSYPGDTIAPRTKHEWVIPADMNEDYTGEFAAEKTPAVNPYGGQKDRQFRGAISETPTDNPTGASGEGGWRRTDLDEYREMSPALKAAQQNLIALRNKEKAVNVSGKRERAPRDRVELDKPKPASVLTKGGQAPNPEMDKMMADFLARGGEIKKGRPGKAPPVGRSQASRHIGGGGKYRKKSDTPGQGANYRGAAIVAVEDDGAVKKESAIMKGLKR